MNRKLLVFTLAALGLGWAGPVGAYPLKFPARATSLDSGEYFSTGGHKGYFDPEMGEGTWALDIGVARFDGSQWRGVTPGATAPYTLDETTGYGTPLYAGADGVVVACWRGLPDAAPGSNYCEPNCPPGHTSGGNFVSIVTPGEDHVVNYLHLAQGSIPAGLCPIVDADGLIDNMSKGSCPSGYSGFRNSTRLDLRLPPGQLPVVKKGDYIGNMGHSGNSSGPHLHLQVNSFMYDDDDDPCQGHSEEIEFVETWYQPRANAPADAYAWEPLEVDPLPIDGTPLLVWPDPLGARKADLVLGDGDSIDVETDVQGGLVAYRNTEGKLRLTSFYIETGNYTGDAGDLTLEDTRNEGGVALLDLVKLPVNERDYVLVIRGNNGNLKAIPYRVDFASGDITRMPGEREDGAVDLLAAAPSPSHSGAVVAVRQDNGTLKVIDYVAAAGTLAISRPGSSASSSEEIIDIAIAPVKGAFNGVVTAEIAPFTGGVTLRSFEVTAGGDVIAVDQAQSLGPVQDVELAPIAGLTGPAVAVAMREGLSGDLVVQTWSVGNNGALTLRDEVAAGSVGAIDVVAVGSSDLVTGMRESNGNLRLISWATNWLSGDLKRSGTRTAGEIVQLDLASYHGTPAATVHPRYDHLLAGVKTGGGALKVLSVATNYSAWY